MAEMDPVLPHRRLLQLGVAIGAVNFTVCLFCVLYFGGVADVASANGPYMLDNHGHLTEVTRSVFTWLRWQELSVFVTHPVAGVCLWRLKRRPTA